jgi:hypothetical protein
MMGITLRTAVAVIILGLANISDWKSFSQAGSKALLYILIDGGVVASVAGMLCYNTAIKGGDADRLYGAFLWGCNGISVRQGTTFLAERCRDAVDRGWDRAAYAWLI